MRNLRSFSALQRNVPVTLTIRSSLRINSNCFSLVKYSKCGNIVLDAKSNSLRSEEKVLQCRRKWYSSSSIPIGQKGQFLKRMSTFRCLPFSIISSWFDRRIRLKVVRDSIFGTQNKYFSMLILVFIFP